MIYEGIDAQEMSRMKMQTTVLITSLAVIIIVILTAWTLNQKPSYVAAVNGEVIEAGEFRLISSQVKNKVFEQFKSEYKLSEPSYDDSFWSKEYGGKSPKDQVKKLAMEQLIQIKLIQSEAMKYGLIDHTDYSYFTKELVKENERRELAASRGEVIYGPVTYEELNYYNYLFDSLLTSLKKQMAANAFKFSDEEVIQQYNKDKEEKYKVADSIEIEQIAVTPSSKNEPENSPASQKALAQMQSLAQRIAQGESFESVWQEQSKLQAVSKTLHIDERNAITYEKHNPQLYAEILKLKAGEMSQIFNANGTYYLLKCTKRKQGGYMPLEEVKESVIRDMAEPRFQEWLASQVSHAKVEIFDKRLGRV